MGYTTVFAGQFDLNKRLDDNTYNLLNGLANTRRMKRDINESLYGVDGEFYIGGKGFRGQGYEDNVIDSNSPPDTQPSLWLQWIPTENRMSIIWDGNEKFYSSAKWIRYLIDTILMPRGYVINGVVNAEGEDGYEYHIKVTHNIVIDRDGFHNGEYPNWEAWSKERYGF